MPTRSARKRGQRRIDAEKRQAAFEKLTPVQKEARQSGKARGKYENKSRN